MRNPGVHNSFAKILFLDIPSLIDSAWRRFDFHAHAETIYRLDDPGHPAPRALWTMPHYAMFVVLVYFVSYGPNPNGLCAIASAEIVALLRIAFGVVIAAATLVAAVRYRSVPADLVHRRFRRLAANGEAVSPARELIVVVLARVVALVPVAAALWSAAYLAGWRSGPMVCAVQHADSYAQLRFALCLFTVVAVGLIGARLRSTAQLIVLQIGAIVMVAAVQWFLLSDAETRQADDLPYRHVFAFWAPCMAAVLLLAPPLVRLMFPVGKPPIAGDPNNLAVESEAFRSWLADTELFDPRDEPKLSWRRLIYAFFYGPFYHPMHLLLLPAWTALVVPPEVLYVAVALSFAVSYLMLVWGNVSTRWDEMNVHLDRWCLRGGPLIVSTLVIALGLMRVFQVDYISTILDALPFGTIFGLIVMIYLLFWFLEYWMNRALAVGLLRILGTGPSEITIAYPRNPPIPAGIGVRAENRFVQLHETGRFIALGYWQPPAAKPGHTAGRGPEVAFNSYYFGELFDRLSRRATTSDQMSYVIDIGRRSGNYFLIMNILMVLITGGFLGYYIYNHNIGTGGIAPVLRTSAEQTAPAPVSLASLLVQQPDQPVRPALVVVASGGGTRAALYTASVLRGLHKLGVDKDIVLLSGVSGGGVALTYFAANSQALVEAQADDPGGCDENSPGASGNWDCFNDRMTKPFIEDVLNGATEWRVFSNTSLSVLLAESFKRRLFKDALISELQGPGLILNTAIVSHPWQDSDLLRRTLDPPPSLAADPSCQEHERVYKLMSGGRLVFTNLRDTERFPGGPAPIVDVLFPYQVVRDGKVPLAVAAALNANFPPVFPSARISIKADKPDDCPRDYYVTDGGAVENLGLLSALYALQGAVAAVEDGKAIRPIHIVLAEASAISYDYGQDRGMSAVGSSRERLAGGLTHGLTAELEALLAKRNKNAAKVKYHYLGLPLAFRARGGFGTHWMYAKTYHLNDPRPRAIPAANFLPSSWGRDRKAEINQADLRQLWSGLHEPDDEFCGRQDFKGEARKVWRWICEPTAASAGPRDLHMEKWHDLVRAMRSYPDR